MPAATVYVSTARRGSSAPLERLTTSAALSAAPARQLRPTRSLGTAPENSRPAPSRQTPMHAPRDPAIFVDSLEKCSHIAGDGWVRVIANFVVSLGAAAAGCAEPGRRGHQPGAAGRARG